MRRKDRIAPHARTAAAMVLAFPGAVLALGGGESAPRGLASAIARALEETSYEPVWQVGTPFAGVEAAWQAPNREHGLRTYFLADGPRVVPRERAGAWSFGTRLHALERGRLRVRVAPADVLVSSGRVEYRRGPLVEWYWNGQDGLEQGFDLAERPLAQAAGEPLALLLEIEGDLRLELVIESVGAIFSDGAPRGQRLSMTKLHAFDARGRTLATHFERRGERLALVVDDRDALYPIVIDPTIQNESQRLAPTLAPDQAEFGTAIDLAGEWAVVGAPGGEHMAGAAYVFLRSGTSWQLEAKLAPSSGRIGDRFGASVAIANGSFVAVGAPGDDTGPSDSGAVHLYRNVGGTWSFDRVLKAPTPELQARFGESLDLSAGWLAIGAPRESARGAASGAVHLFQYSVGNWLHFVRLAPEGLAAGDRLGSSIDFGGARFAAGAPGNGGKVWIFALSSGGSPTQWQVQQVLSEAQMLDMGRSVALDGVGLLVGSPATGPAGSQRGRASYYEEGGGQFTLRWSAAGEADGDRLGHSVALQRVTTGTSKAVIGVPGSDVAAQDGGGVHALATNDGSTWLLLGNTFSGSTSAGERFGSALALEGGLALGGAPWRAEAETRPGAVIELGWTGTNWTPGASWRGTEAEEEQRFGLALDVLGDLAVIGAPGDSDAAQRAGAVFVFQRTGGEWVQGARLTAGAFARAGAEFGSAVAIGAGGQRLLVGAPLEDGSAARCGAAYLFTRSLSGTWSLARRFEAWDPTTNTRFGGAVALGGELAVVGAWLANGAVARSGAAYVWRTNGLGWLAEQKLIDANGQVDDTFGFALWTDGNEIAVGAPWSSSVASNAGSIAFFERVGPSWLHVQSQHGQGAGEELGVALAGEGDLLVGGAPGAGAVRLYRRGSGAWLYESSLASPTGAPGEEFGYAVGIAGGRVAVGAFGANGSAQDCGRAYVFEKRPLDWQLGELVASDASAQDFLGYSVSISGDVLLAGAPRKSLGATDSGAAYAFQLEPPAGPFVAYGFGDGSHGDCWCHGNSAPGAGEGCRNSTGKGAILYATGSASVSADDVRMHGEQLRPSQAALLFCGPKTAPGISFGDGLRFVGGSLKRLGVKIPSATGKASWGPGLRARGQWKAGERRYFQIWYRDPSLGVCSTNFNLSSALEVSFDE